MTCIVCGGLKHSNDANRILKLCGACGEYTYQYRDEYETQRLTKAAQRHKRTAHYVHYFEFGEADATEEELHVE